MAILSLIATSMTGYYYLKQAGDAMGKKDDADFDKAALWLAIDGIDLYRSLNIRGGEFYVYS